MKLEVLKMEILVAEMYEGADEERWMEGERERGSQLKLEYEEEGKGRGNHVR
eukprot:CAMPEP_0201531168 /NCGR_PEP_ID=MMETSP0161_2-20130828/46769_1 /ASSEMBLY_ACC=CAM_ASM_000251 /TAXON_ID=180227 /ORGANISM="Neoparamoeba aestuarina, Strain SoJaBio B1-5/56/2" /LENGTH=51 /DNA_ID=CAMNT_0047933891 /DNA_START=134 /DNA_END=286 /DNA_ORIENTATION=+